MGLELYSLYNIKLKPASVPDFDASILGVNRRQETLRKLSTPSRFIGAERLSLI
jgi:hypothetical protein